MELYCFQLTSYCIHCTNHGDVYSMYYILYIYMLYIYIYMGVVLKVLVLSVVFDDLWYAKMIFGES